MSKRTLEESVFDSRVKSPEQRYIESARAAYAAGERRRESGKKPLTYHNGLYQDFYLAGYHRLTD